MRRRGGQNHLRRWFIKQAGGDYVSVENRSPALAREAFPELPITLQWENDEDLALIEDYLAWKAPQLLLLPELSPPIRERLERLAVKHAEQIERFWRLYPEIHNKTLLNNARVEAKIRSSNKT